MNPRSVWIERGPDGRPYFVRKKSSLPSTRELLAQAFLPRSARSRLLSRDSRQNRHVVCINPVSHPLVLPAPGSPNPFLPHAPFHPPPMDPTSQAQPLPVAMYLVPQQQNHNQNQTQNQQNSKNQSAQPPANIMNPPPPFFSVPLPGMYPIPPDPFAAHPPTILPQPVQFPAQHLTQQPLFPTTLIGAVPIQNQPLGSAAGIRPPIAPLPETRYKCDICGRYRSARYHFKHPIPPGQLPAKTICRKCQEEATDSEEESTLDSDESHRSRRRHFRGPRRRSTSGSKRRYLSPSRARSVGRRRLIDDGHTSFRRSSYSNSSTSGSERERGGDRGRRYRPFGPSTTDLVRHARRLRLSPREERVYHDREYTGRSWVYAGNFEDGESRNEVTARRFV